MGEKDKDKKDRSKRAERSSGRDRDRDSDRGHASSRSLGRGPGLSRATSMKSMKSVGDNLSGGDGGGRDRRSDLDKPRRSSSSRNLTRDSSAGSLRPSTSTGRKEGSGRMERSSSFKGKSNDKKSDGDGGAKTTGGRRTLERQSSNNEDSMAMLLGLAGKKAPPKRSGSSSSSSSSSSNSSNPSKGPPLTGEKPKAKNTKLNPKLFSGQNHGGETREGNKLKESDTVLQKRLEKTEANIDDGSLDLSEKKGSIPHTRDDSSEYTDGSGVPPVGKKAAMVTRKFNDRSEESGLTLNMSKLTFPTVDASSKKKPPTEPNAFISRPDLRTVDQSVNLRDLEAGKKKKPSLSDVYLGESGSTAFSSREFSSGGGSSRNSFVRNKKNPYLKVSAWEKFSYYAKDFCRSLSDCFCNKTCALFMLVAVVAGVLLAVLMTQKIIIKSSKLLVVDTGLSHTVVNTIEHEGVTYLAPVFTEEEVVERIETFQKILRAHGMNPTNACAHEALSWIAQFDPVRLGIEANEGAILQRYALAVLFFTTHPGTMANRTTDQALSSGINDSVDTDLDDNSVSEGAHQEDQDQRRIDSFGANWMMGDTCSWQGIVCEETRTLVVHLNLSGAMLQGTVPVELALLKELTKIDMSHNYLEGPLPDLYIERLTKLNYLMLQDNLLSGVLPANIGTWTSLTYVNLAENKIGGSLPVDLDQLSNLILLFLHGNRLSGPIPSFKGMTDLAYLYMNNNAFSGQLPKDLFRNKELVDVRLEYNSITGTIPDQVHHLHRLEVLSLGNNDMNGTLPDMFQHMKNLIALDLHKNDFSGTLPGSIGELSKLEHLLLDNNEFTGTLSYDWFEMENLMTLVLHHNKLSGEIPSSINGLASLRDLWLNNNLFVGSIPEELGQVKSLVNVYLHNNGLTGQIPSNFHALENLGALRLYNNDLTGDISPVLCELKQQHSLSYLAADCKSEINCTCCDKCY